MLVVRETELQANSQLSETATQFSPFWARNSVAKLRAVLETAALSTIR